ncbi:TIGR03086 family metal-binding protein [Streptomyces gilvus]|uniref:TIGR03086 family metal-binding protein n=1 Tax=Streptomyces gilvus TaxID=2920937 RepID=UPI001F0D10E1|nr:TIGR03086 family metal-binding protein [Streptomyces sp. CME 23]MCH5674280.1 TIGR03086 family metal-binding protein [Streptomyces sp. CME 23]
MNAIDPRPVYARATEQAAALIAAVRADQLDSPTPCAEFDVRTLLSHMVGGTLRIAVVGEGGDGLAVHPFAEGVGDDEWPAAYEEVRVRVLKAWEDDARLEAPVRVPWGEVPGRAALSGYVMELVTHTWDLWESLGRPYELDPEPAEFALAVARRVLPDPERDADTPFASVVPAPEGADAYGRLAAWLGREPLVRA